MTGDTDRWQQLLQTVLVHQSRPSLAVIGFGIVLACALGLPRGSWHVTRHAITIFHEGGHALISLLLGGRRQRITLNMDTSGVTQSAYVAGGFGQRLRLVLVASAGYTATSVLGVLLAWLLVAGYAGAGLLGLLIALILVLLHVRNLWGWLSVLVTAGCLLLGAWLLPQIYLTGLVMIVTAFFLLGGLRTAWEQRLHRLAWRGGPDGSDAAQIAKALLLPVAVPLWGFIIADGACVLAAGYLLVVGAPLG